MPTAYHIEKIEDLSRGELDDSAPCNPPIGGLQNVEMK